MILFDITIDEVIQSRYSRADLSGLLEYLFEVSFCPAALYVSSQRLVLKNVLKSVCDIFIPKLKIPSAQFPTWFNPEKTLDKTCSYTRCKLRHKPSLPPYQSNKEKKMMEQAYTLFLFMEYKPFFHI